MAPGQGKQNTRPKTLLLASRKKQAQDHEPTKKMDGSGERLAGLSALFQRWKKNRGGQGGREKDHKIIASERTASNFR